MGGRNLAAPLNFNQYCHLEYQTARAAEMLQKEEKMYAAGLPAARGAAIQASNARHKRLGVVAS